MESVARNDGMRRRRYHFFVFSFCYLDLDERSKLIRSRFLFYFPLQSHQSNVVLVAPHRQLEWKHPGWCQWRHVSSVWLGGSHRSRRQSLLHQVSNTEIGQLDR